MEHHLNIVSISRGLFSYYVGQIITTETYLSHISCWLFIPKWDFAPVFFFFFFFVYVFLISARHQMELQKKKKLTHLPLFGQTGWDIIMHVQQICSSVVSDTPGFRSSLKEKGEEENEGKSRRWGDVSEYRWNVGAVRSSFSLVYYVINTSNCSSLLFQAYFNWTRNSEQ